MNIFLKARIEKSKKYPILSDRRSIGAFLKEISDYEYKKIETDNYYIAHPLTYEILINFFEDLKLATSLCDKCIIKTIDTNMFKEKFKIKDKRVDLRFEQNSNLVNKHTYLYKARLHAAQFDYHYLNREFVCRKTGLSYKKLSLIENDSTYIPRFEELYSLITVYKSTELLKTVCENCLINKKIKKIKERSL